MRNKAKGQWLLRWLKIQKMLLHIRMNKGCKNGSIMKCISNRFLSSNHIFTVSSMPNTCFFVFFFLFSMVLKWQMLLTEMFPDLCSQNDQPLLLKSEVWVLYFSNAYETFLLKAFLSKIVKEYWKRKNSENKVNKFYVHFILLLYTSAY